MIPAGTPRGNHLPNTSVFLSPDPPSSAAFRDDRPRSTTGSDPPGTSPLSRGTDTPGHPGCQCGAPGRAGESCSSSSPWQPLRPVPRPSCMVWVPLRSTRTDRRAPLCAAPARRTTMSLEWLLDWSWSLDGLRDFIATGIQSFRDCDTSALAAVACLLLLFVWYCYHVGREQPRAYPTVNALMQSAEANGVQNGFVYCHSPECVRCAHHDGLNQKLYHNLQEYAKRYSWSGMGRIHKGIREQGRYLNSRPSIQKPEVFFLPDLPTMPYFSRDAQKHDVELLERNFQTILCEFETLYKAFSNCSLPQGWKMNSTPSGEWFTFYLVNQGMCVPRNCRRCPRTYRLLGSLRTCIGNNVFGNACISVLSPGTVIAEHYGPTNIRIRCHLGKCLAGFRPGWVSLPRAMLGGCSHTCVQEPTKGLLHPVLTQFSN